MVRRVVVRAVLRPPAQTLRQTAVVERALSPDARALLKEHPQAAGADVPKVSPPVQATAMTEPGSASEQLRALAAAQQSAADSEQPVPTQFWQRWVRASAAAQQSAADSEQPVPTQFWQRWVRASAAAQQNAADSEQPVPTQFWQRWVRASGRSVMFGRWAL